MRLFLFALFVYFFSLFFREERFSREICERAIARFSPTNLVVRCEAVSFGFNNGIRVHNLQVYEREKFDRGIELAGAAEIELRPFMRRVKIVGARYPRLPESYYAPINIEKNARVEAEFPEISRFELILEKPDILAVRPQKVLANVDVTRHRISFSDIRLEWRNPDIGGLLGKCTVDLDEQQVAGFVDGYAIQADIRPMLVALDVPVSLPYIDGFTEVPGHVRARCEWKVNLINNMFDLWLDLHPNLGKYNGVAMRKADGKIHLNSLTQGNCLNYLTEVGPITAVSPDEKPLAGQILISGTNNYNIVRVDAKSSLSIADVLRIGGFEGKYVGDDVVGDATGKLEFRFPRAMTNNYEMLNGEGHVTVKNGQLMRLGLFAGLTKLLAEHVPGISFLVDQTEASADYRIENGVIKTDNIFIEGGVFSIIMFGQFDATKDKLDFTVRVQFTKKDSLMGKYFIHPVTWPFTKLLMEFRLTGSSTEPQWTYLSVLDRVMDIIK